MIVREAQSSDVEKMAALLNAVIKAGGTTALEALVDVQEIQKWMSRNPGRTTWFAAFEGARLLGFQWTEPNSALPDDATDIATFARIGVRGKGVGTALFAQTTKGCRRLGYKWINASIRSDNTSGLSYYAKMGFVDWKHDPTIALSDGTVTGKTYKRFDL